VSIGAPIWLALSATLSQQLIVPPPPQDCGIRWECAARDLSGVVVYSMRGHTVAETREQFMLPVSQRGQNREMVIDGGPAWVQGTHKFNWVVTRLEFQRLYRVAVRVGDRFMELNFVFPNGKTGSVAVVKQPTTDELLAGGATSNVEGAGVCTLERV
jgi:hypothetical protein